MYRAHDLNHDRAVALNVLKPELAAVLGAERFFQEIKTTAHLQHPHILPLFHCGQAESFIYYVMPFVEGETLRAKLDREKQLGIDEAVKITTEVADALDYAHRHGVIHRDIKPENILLQDGRPVVADCGIAQAVAAGLCDPLDPESLTETGIIVGTPAYMSPEQATGSTDLDGRSDLYSLGCVLYEMLAGEPPYTAATVHALLAKKLTDPVRRLSAVRKTVPRAVERVVRRALSQERADRFSTAHAFGEALAGALASSTGSSLTTGRWSWRVWLAHLKRTGGN